MTARPPLEDSYVGRLSDKHLDIRSKYTVLAEIRESLESFQSSPETYDRLLQGLIPALISQLEKVPPSFLPNSVDQRYRHAVLDLLHRLPTADSLRQYAVDLNKALMSTLRVDNEENGIVCMKILTGLHRSYKAVLSDNVQSFFDFVIELYRNMPIVVKDSFSGTSAAAIGNTPETSFQSPRPFSPSGSTVEPNESQHQRPLARSLFSFKVLTECPIVVVLLFSSHKQLVQTNLESFAPRIIEMLQLQVPAQAEAHANAAARGTVFTGIAPSIRNRQAFGDFLTAQVKTMSFLAYILRSFSSMLKPYYPLIPDFVVRLLQDCPRDLSASRKELLVATRHILSTEFRNNFISKVELLLNESVLLGDGLTVRETLRPLAYSMVADLIHQVRSELNTFQLAKTITVYCRNLCDGSLAPSFQVMSAKLLMNLVDRIMKLPDRTEGRRLLMYILDAFSRKFSELNLSSSHISITTTPNNDSTQENHKVEQDEKKLSTSSSRRAEMHEIASHNPILLHPPHQDEDYSREGRYVLRTMIHFLKTIIFGLRSCNPPPPNPAVNPDQWNAVTRGFSSDDIFVFRVLLREGFNAFKYYAISRKETVKSINNDKLSRSPGHQDTPHSVQYGMSEPTKEEKDMMETFATVFIYIDPATFEEIIDTELPYLYDTVQENVAALHVFQFFLASETTSCCFVAKLLDFLMERLQDLGRQVSRESNLMLRLFKLILMAVNLFPATNEAILLPHLRDIIVKSMRLATTAQEPSNYYYLLRTLFRSIGGGRFEMLYKEVLPLLQALLDSLNKLIDLSQKVQERELFVELCLTVPVRLSVLVPHLSSLMRPLVIALNGGPELVSQGLRTLELCVDNLTPEYFDPIVEPSLHDIMKAMWAHLKPLPYSHQHSHTSLRILGKLGGRNRKFLQPPADLSNRGYADSTLSVRFDIEGIPGKKPVEFLPLVEEVLSILNDPRTSASNGVHCFRYLSAVLKLFLDSNPLPSHFSNSLSQAVKSYLNLNPRINSDLPPGTISQSYAKLHAQESLLTQLIGSVLLSAGYSEVKQEASELLGNLSQHFVLVELEQDYARSESNMEAFSSNVSNQTPVLRIETFLKAIASGLASLNSDVQEASFDCLRRIHSTCVTLFGPTEFWRFHVYRSLSSLFCHECYDKMWHRKNAGCLGLSFMIKEMDLPRSWLKEHQLEYVRTLLFILKDTPEEVDASVTQRSRDLLALVLSKANESIEEQELTSRPFYMLTGTLAYELLSSNAVVRETARSSFNLISQITGKSIAEHLQPVKSTFLTPIFGKPLRALPFAIQIGHLDAIIFCLGIDSSFLELNEELVRLLMEALALADADDDSLASAHKVSEYRTSELLIKLRVVCLELLALALDNPDFAQIQQAPVRTRIISVFFKTLYSHSKEVIDAANSGLRTVLSQNVKLPKDLLQNGLRPILMNLSDHKRLTVAGLEGLARLLELLTNYFKVEIGKKLLDHLKALADTGSLYYASGEVLSSQKNIQIIAAILNVYHLLPNKADMFLDDLLQIVLFLETSLRRQYISPFREPLAKFVNRFSAESWDRFSVRIGDCQAGQLLVGLADLDICLDFRAIIFQRLDKIDLILNKTSIDSQLAVACINTVSLLDCLVSHRPDILQRLSGRLKGLLGRLDEIHRASATNPEISKMSLALKQAADKLQSIFLRLIKSTESLEDLIILIDAGSRGTFEFSPKVENYVFDNIVCCDDAHRRIEAITFFLTFINGKETHMTTRTFLLSKIVNPIIIQEAYRNGDISALTSQKNGENDWLVQIHSHIWKPSSLEFSDDGSRSADYYLLELLRLTSLLLKYCPQDISDYRKDVIKFAWNYFKLEDAMSKQAVYVTIAYFIAAYDTPSKIVTQIYVSLLKAYQPEAKYEVHAALDILAPSLPKRIPSLLWARWPRKVLGEESPTISVIVNIYQFIVRHGDLFFDSRDHYSGLMVATLPRLGFAANNSLENQTLAIDIVQLLLQWQKKQMELDDNREEENNEEEDPASSKKRKASSLDDSSTAPSKSPAIKNDFRLNFQLRESILTFLIRFVCTVHNRSIKSPLCKRAIELVHGFLDPNLKPEINIKLSFFDRCLPSESSEVNLIQYSNALDVLHAIIEQRPPEWAIDNLEELDRLLYRSIRTDIPEAVDPLNSVFTLLFEKLFSPSLDPETQTSPKFQKFISNIISGLQDNLSLGHSLKSSVLLMQTVNRFKPSAIDSLLPSLIKYFTKLSKDYLTYLQQQQQQHQQQQQQQQESRQSTTHEGANGKNGSNGTSNPTEYGSSPLLDESHLQSVVHQLEIVIDIGNSRMEALADQRRIFLSYISQLTERATDIHLCMKMLSMVRDWIFEEKYLFPTTKEKTAILLKMMMFETRGNESLTDSYYQLVADIYSTQSLLRTELTIRMEHAFMMGTRVNNSTIRRELMSILDQSLEKPLQKRLLYVIRDQSWEGLADYFYLNQALQLLYGAISPGSPVTLSASEFKTAGIASGLREVEDEQNNGAIEDGVNEDNTTSSSSIADLLERYESFQSALHNVSAQDVLDPLVELQYCSNRLTHHAWISFFPVACNAVLKRERAELFRAFIMFLSRDFHPRQSDRRPNVIKTVLAGLSKCTQVIQMPPHLVKYCGKAYGGWYEAIHLLEATENNSLTDSQAVRDAAADTLVEMYAALQDDDMFYGLWRRRCQYLETSSAISYEQRGSWDRAQQLYEQAQIKARSGVLPYGEAEYNLWEDHWILCAQKLQQWDILTELAKHEGFTDLLLECAWRMADWTADREPLEQSIRSVMDVPTPRRQTFEAFMCLQKYSQKLETLNGLSKSCDEGIQLTLRSWHSLPPRFTGAHIPLLHTFQQYVELMEASEIYNSLSVTNAQNLDVKSQEIKGVLQAWRERLPNVWDDINIWGDLVSWRQHVFAVINKVYLPLVSSLQSSSSINSNTNSYVYRGYHEIAWIINRFAHVARKHSMPDVCINQLTKIYTLPNIEIQEAFLKLREQAKCHYNNPNELNTGLEVISNTNLVYFGAQQKAEFFTLKGMFLAKLNMLDEANQAFATAVQIDLNLAKAWCEWGRFNDRRFKEAPKDIIFASSAVSCYLQAAGLFKNGKTRALLGRILWILSLDDAAQSLVRAFENYRGEVPVWYWITFIPQLLTSLSHKEASIARQIIVKIAKAFPQALHFFLRTTKEDYAVIQRQALQAARSAQRVGQPVQNRTSSEEKSASPTDQPPGINAKAEEEAANNQGQEQNPAFGRSSSIRPQVVVNSIRQPWEYVEEIMGILKTAYPLLALSLETFVDQIYQRFKCPADEDAYRLIVALFNDGVQYMSRLSFPREDSKLPPATEANITRFAESVLPKHIRKAFQEDFVSERPNLYAYVSKLRKWRDRFEDKLDRRSPTISLETLSPHLSEFHCQKFEEMEVPGQYLLLKDNNIHFSKVSRFLPNVDVVRGFGLCYRRLTIEGTDGSLHPFSVQYPAARHCRREERITQLFRILNSVLTRQKESRKRNLQFHLPAAVPLSPHIRIIEDDPSFISLQAIYEDYCHRNGKSKDEPFLYSLKKYRESLDPKQGKPDIAAIKMEIFNSVQADLVPNSIVSDYFLSSYKSFEDFWLFRKQFSYSYAGVTFMTYMMSVSNRYPHKILLSRSSGDVWSAEMLPMLPPHKPAPSFQNSDPVPFRFTPNIQTLIGSTAIEGLYSCSIMAIAKSLSDPDYDLEPQLSLFVRDEIISWYTQQHRPSVQDQQLRELVKVNSDSIVKKVSSLAHVSTGNIPANQTVIDLISQAVNPRNLALADGLWMPFL